MARLIVEAGPGTGKTAVACRRVAWLSRDAGLNAANILLLSFTRAAVAELRHRIAHFMGSAARAAALRIATVDSHAWQLHQAFGEDVPASMSYSENIAHVAERVRTRDQEYVGFLSRLRHVVIDEAQDLLGGRAELLRGVIDALDPECGVTVFADPAQAIYGFTGDGDRAAGASPGLLELLGVRTATPFERKRLTKIHRTKAPKLLRLFSIAREKVVPAPGEPVTVGYERLRDALLREAPAAAALDGNGHASSSRLELYRYRSEVVRRSHELCGSGAMHRTRMSRVPMCPHPWIGWLLAPVADASLDKPRFDELWEERRLRALFPGDEPAACFELLQRTAPGGRRSVDLKGLRRALARARPPADLCLPDCGASGTIIGTIHASKGREADVVHVRLPRRAPANTSEEEVLEEMRVLYVGATRARQDLLVEEASSIGCSYTDQGRCWQGLPRQGAAFRARVEVGLGGDLDDAASVHADVAMLAEDATAAQEQLAKASQQVVEVEAVASPDWDWRHRLRAPDGSTTCLGALTRTFANDLRAIARSFGSCGTPRRVGHLYLRGARTVVLAEDDPRVGALHPPYRESRTFLAPLVCGYPTMYFNSWV